MTDHALVIAAIADPTRRTLLDALRRHDGQTIGELHEAVPHLGRHVVLKHVRTLEAAQLVTTRKVGRSRHCYLNPVPLVELSRRWLDDFGAAWGTALLDLRNHVTDRHEESDMQPPSHVQRIVIDAPASRVWHALTDPEESAKWYYGTGVNSTWEPGAEYAYRSSDGTMAIEGTIERTEPPHLLIMTFNARWSEAVAADRPSRVTWRIEESDGLSTVTVIHEDVPAATDAEVTSGWPYLLGNLKTFIETGEPMRRTAA